MLLVTHQDMGHQWRLTWQKGDGQLNCLPMPVLTILPLEFHATYGFIELMKEPELCSHTEVGNCQEAEFFKHKFT